MSLDIPHSLNTSSPILEEFVGMRLDRWLRQTYPFLTQGLIQKYLRQKSIRVNGTRAQASYHLTLNDIISLSPSLIPKSTIKRKLLSPEVLSPSDQTWLMSLILWEDDQLMILNKPAGLAVQGGTGTYRHVDGLLQAYGASTQQRYRLVHRLDRETSGVLAIAKRSEMARSLTNQFRQGIPKKVYIALVTGHLKPREGCIDAPLTKFIQQEKIIVDPKGRSALSHYRVLAHLKSGLSIVALMPQTGRTHQLRVHMAHLGHPILGDKKYTPSFSKENSMTLHLHAYQLTVQDHEGVSLTFTAPLPETLIRKMEGVTLSLS